MHIETGRFFTLSGAGQRIWELMAEPITIGTLTAQLTREFDIDAQTCFTDVVEYCERLQSGELIDVAP